MSSMAPKLTRGVQCTRYLPSCCTHVTSLKVDIHDNFRRLCKWSWISLCTELYWTSDSQLIKPASKFSIFFCRSLAYVFASLSTEGPNKLPTQSYEFNVAFSSIFWTVVKRLQHRTPCYHCVISPISSGAMSQSIIVTSNHHDGNL